MACDTWFFFTSVWFLKYAKTQCAVTAVSGPPGGDVARPQHCCNKTKWLHLKLVVVKKPPATRGILDEIWLALFVGRQIVWPIITQSNNTHHSTFLNVEDSSRLMMMGWSSASCWRLILFIVQQLQIPQGLLLFLSLFESYDLFKMYQAPDLFIYFSNQQPYSRRMSLLFFSTDSSSSRSFEELMVLTKSTPKSSALRPPAPDDLTDDDYGLSF